MDISATDIIEVQSKAQLNKFIDFPYQLYKNEPTWVPPLRIAQRTLFNPRHLFWEKNPHRFFLAFKNNRCVGRIAAFVNKEHNDFHHSAEGCFGFLESGCDQDIFNKLLIAAESFVTQNDCIKIIGPLNPSLHYELGVLTDGFQYPPYCMLTHNFSYYDNMIKSSGYVKEKDFYSYKLNASQYIPTSKMNRVSSLIQSRHNITIRTASIKSFDKELDIFYDIYNDAFTGHWGFTPMEKKEFRLLAKDMKSVIDLRMVLIAEINKEPVAFLLCLPNFNDIFIHIRNGRLLPMGILKIITGRKKIRSIRVITVAVKKSFGHLGLGAVLYPEIMKRGLQYKYSDCELSWVVEDNIKVNQIATELGALPYKTYRLYSKNFKTG